MPYVKKWIYNTVSTIIEAALSLIARAKEAEKESECVFLLQAAKRLCPDVITIEIRADWINQWLETNKNRTGANYNEQAS